jgi:hypothetical protein
MSNPISTRSAGSAKFTRASSQKECDINRSHKWVTLNLASDINC